MKILKDYSLYNLNYFKIKASARELIYIEREEDYHHLFDGKILNNGPHMILGDGSNILFTTDFDGICIKTLLDGISVVKEDKRHVWLRVESGMNWHKLVLRTLDMGLQGLENLSLIPGTVGASPIQNIGAYGVEIKEFIDQVEALDIKGGEVFNLSNKDCEFNYRSSIFKKQYKNRFLIKSILLRLNKIPRYNTSYDMILETMDELNLKEVNAKNISNAVIHIRKKKLPDPDTTGNAGSFFKNPIVDKTDYEGLRAEFPGIKGFQLDKTQFKVSAAWLIEACGWKGKHLGDAGVHSNQPLVLINRGKASGREILSLSEKIREDVAHKFGIELQPEVNIV